MIKKTFFSLAEVKALLKDGYKVVSISYWEDGKSGYTYRLEKTITW